MLRFFAVLVLSSGMWAYQSADPSQQQRDTPTQQPGTKNPDIGQRKAAAHAKGKAKSTKGETSKQPNEPQTNSPDTAKRNAPKKSKTNTSTAH